MSGFGNVLAVLFWEEITLTQEMVVIRTTALIAQWAGPGLTVGSYVRLVWSSVAGGFTIVTISRAHNLASSVVRISSSKEVRA